MVKKAKEENEQLTENVKMPEKDTFFSTGSTLLNCVLGGGYPLGKIVNVVGNRSAGKTLLAIEACINFLKKFPNGKVFYNETEAAFSTDYAAKLGMPIDKINFHKSFTVEDVFTSMEKILSENEKTPMLYILDSLDALSDNAELERDITDGSFGASKAKLLSELFRRLANKLESAQMTVIFISQIRDKLNVTYGKKWERSGGKALDFYASQIIHLTEIEKNKKTIKGIERIVGVTVKAYCEKCKTGFPFRSCTFPIYFGYGVDSVEASLEFLKQVKKLEDLPFVIENIGKYTTETRNMSSYDKETRDELVKQVIIIEDLAFNTWLEIEKGFEVKGSKYF